MREIKFRAWDKVLNKMLVAGDSNLPDLTCNGCPIEPHTRKNLSMEMELMQFTGLLDKSGKEIYEGDVVRGVYPHYTTEQIGIVEYGALAFSFIRRKDGQIQWMDTITNPSYTEAEIEVIGNIYENPELLK